MRDISNVQQSTLSESMYYYESTLAEVETDEFTDAVLQIIQKNRNN